MVESIRVLHVDDDADFGTITAKQLARVDGRLEVDHVSAVDEAMARLEGVDCVISDYDMPGRTGIEFLEAVRVDHPDLPFILFTGKGSEEVASGAISAGVTDYLQKETTTDVYAVLANRIDNVVQRQRAQVNYREIFEKMPDGVTLHDPDDGAILDANLRFCELLGYTRDELLELTFDDIHIDEPPYTSERARDLIRRAVEEGSLTFEWIDRTKAGEHVHVEVSLRQTTIDGVDRILAVVRDIPERKERQGELERYRTVVQVSGDPMYTLDASGDLTYVNDALVELTGHNEDDLVGTHASHVMDDADVEQAESLIRQLLASEEDRATFEMDVITADGERIPCENHIALLPFEDEFRGTVGVVRDISDRKRAEEQRYKAIFNQTYQFTGLMEPDGTLLEANDTALEFGDLDREDVVGKPFWEAGWWQIDEATRQRLKDAIDRAAAGEFVRYETEVRGGEENAIIDFSIRPVTDESGAVTMLIPEGRDITERKRHEREKQRLDEFASIVSHDLRNPLNVANGRLELVREEFDSPHLGHIEQAHERMEALIEDLLTLARSGAQIDELEAVDLADLVESCWQTVDTRAATIVVEAERVVHADRSRLQQLLENLLRNAVDHGGEDVTVTIGDLDDGFFVADDGPGIDPEVGDDIFESGFSTSAEGTGFGLSIVREIASAHGWTIAVTEADGGGARFEITGLG